MTNFEITLWIIGGIFLFISVILFFVGIHIYSTYQEIEHESKTEKEKESKRKLNIGANIIFNYIGIPFSIGIFICMFAILFPYIDKEFGIDEKYNVIETVEGKRESIANRGNSTKYYISLSDNKEYEINGHEYSILEKGNEVNVIHHDIIGGISKEHYYFEDLG